MKKSLNIILILFLSLISTISFNNIKEIKAEPNTIYVSELSDNEDFEYSQDTTIIIDANKTINSIKRSYYDAAELIIKSSGNYTLTVNDNIYASNTTVTLESGNVIVKGKNVESGSIVLANKLTIDGGNLTINYNNSNESYGFIFAIRTSGSVECLDINKGKISINLKSDTKTLAGISSFLNMYGGEINIDINAKNEDSYGLYDSSLFMEDGLMNINVNNDSDLNAHCIGIEAYKLDMQGGKIITKASSGSYYRGEGLVYKGSPRLYIKDGEIYAEGTCHGITCAKSIYAEGKAKITGICTSTDRNYGPAGKGIEIKEDLSLFGMASIIATSLSKDGLSVKGGICVQDNAYIYGANLNPSNESDYANGISTLFISIVGTPTIIGEVKVAEPYRDNCAIYAGEGITLSDKVQIANGDIYDSSNKAIMTHDGKYSKYAVIEPIRTIDITVVFYDQNKRTILNTGDTISVSYNGRYDIYPKDENKTIKVAEGQPYYLEFKDTKNSGYQFLGWKDNYMHNYFKTEEVIVEDEALSMRNLYAVVKSDTPAESITLNKTKANLLINKTLNLKVNILPTETTNKEVTWSSSNKNVATVDENGKVKALKTGKTNIIAKTHNGKEAKCEITVILDKPKLVAIYNSAKGADIRFKPLDNATEYVIMKKTDGVWAAIKTVKASDLEKAGGNYKYIDETIKDNYGKGYIYSVAAKDNNGTYDYDTKGLALYRLKAPTIKSIVANGNGKVTLTWSKETCHGYEIQYSSDNGTNWLKYPEIKDPNKTTITINNLDKNKTYVFRIRCQKTNPDRGVGWSQYSSWAKVNVK